MVIWSCSTSGVTSRIRSVIRIWSLCGKPVVARHRLLDADGIDDQRVAVPLPDRVSVVAGRHLVDRQLRLIEIDAPHFAERLGDDRDLPGRLEDLDRIDATAIIRGMPYGRHSTAGVGGGSPACVALRIRRAARLVGAARTPASARSASPAAERAWDRRRGHRPSAPRRR